MDCCASQSVLHPVILIRNVPILQLAPWLELYKQTALRRYLQLVKDLAGQIFLDKSYQTVTKLAGMVENVLVETDASVGVAGREGFAIKIRLTRKSINSHCHIILSTLSWWL
jgi:hypothetical protein